jgi:hypothetical protein
MTEFELSAGEEPLGETSDVGGPGERNWRVVREALAREKAALAREQARTAELEAELAKRLGDDETIGNLRAEVTFLRAGVDTTRPSAARFAESYDGPLDPESVQVAFADYLADAKAAAHDFAAHVVRSTTNGGSNV